MKKRDLFNSQFLKLKAQIALHSLWKRPSLILYHVLAKVHVYMAGFSPAACKATKIQSWQLQPQTL